MYDNIGYAMNIVSKPAVVPCERSEQTNCKRQSLLKIYPTHTSLWIHKHKPTMFCNCSQRVFWPTIERFLFNGGVPKNKMFLAQVGIASGGTTALAIFTINARTSTKIKPIILSMFRELVLALAFMNLSICLDFVFCFLFTQKSQRKAIYLDRPKCPVDHAYAIHSQIRW